MIWPDYYRRIFLFLIEIRHVYSESNKTTWLLCLMLLTRTDRSFFGCHLVIYHFTLCLRRFIWPNLAHRIGHNTRIYLSFLYYLIHSFYSVIQYLFICEDLKWILDSHKMQSYSYSVTSIQLHGRKEKFEDQCLYCNIHHVTAAVGQS